MKLSSWIFFIVLGIAWGLVGVSYTGNFLFIPTRISELAFSGAMLYVFSALVGAAIVVLIGLVNDSLGGKKK